MNLLLDTALQNAPRFFGRRIFLRVATAFCALFALLLLAVWRQHAAGPAALERALPIEQLDATPPSGGYDEPPPPPSQP
jgi:hypothetical protein